MDPYSLVLPLAFIDEFAKLAAKKPVRITNPSAFGGMARALGVSEDAAHRVDNVMGPAAVHLSEEAQQRLKDAAGPVVDIINAAGALVGKKPRTTEDWIREQSVEGWGTRQVAKAFGQDLPFLSNILPSVSGEGLNLLKHVTPLPGQRESERILLSPGIPKGLFLPPAAQIRQAELDNISNISNISNIANPVGS